MNLKSLVTAAGMALAAYSSPANSGIEVKHLLKPDCYNAYMMGGSVPWTIIYWLHLEDLNGDGTYDTKNIIGPESRTKERLREIIPNEEFLQKWFHKETRPHCKEIENIG